MLYADLKIAIRELTEMFTYDEFNYWCTMNITFSMPDSIKSKYEEHEIRPTTVAQTYIEKEYKDLLVYSFILRLFWPIWTTFMISNEKEIPEEYKEIQCFNMAKDTWITDNHVVAKLEAYINSNIKINAIDFITNSIKNTGIDKTGDLILASIVLSKLPYYDNQEVNRDKSLIHTVFHFINQKLGKKKLGDKRFNGANTVTEKRMDVKDSNGEEIGILESFKAKKLTSPGSEVITNMYIQHYDKQIAERLLGAENVHVYTAIRNNLAGIGVIKAFQFSICSFVMCNFITSKSIYNCSKPNMCNVIALTAAWLLINKHNNIACAIASKEYSNDDDIQLTNMIPGRNRISAEVTKKLEELFPIVRASNKNSASQINQSISMLNDDMSGNDRCILIPQNILDMFGGAAAAKHGRYTSQMSTRVDLANMIIDGCEKLNLVYVAN
jgi:hypothetical protein